MTATKKIIKKTSIDLRYNVGKKVHFFMHTAEGDFAAAWTSAVIQIKRRHKSAHKIVWTATASFTTSGPFEPIEPSAPTMAVAEDEPSKSPWVYIPTDAEMDVRYALTESLDPAFAQRERAHFEAKDARQLKRDINFAWYGNDSTSFQKNRYYLHKLTGERYGNGSL